MYGVWEALLEREAHMEERQQYVMGTLRRLLIEMRNSGMQGVIKRWKKHTMEARVDEMEASLPTEVLDQREHLAKIESLESELTKFKNELSVARSQTKLFAKESKVQSMRVKAKEAELEACLAEHEE